MAHSVHLTEAGMGPAFQTTFRGMSSSLWIEAHVETWVARLQRSCGPILSCSVLIDRPRQHGRNGNTLHIRINLAIPGRQFAISRDADCDDSDEGVYRALSDVFRTARGQLQEHAGAADQRAEPMWR